jgi:hypothetical protein
MAVRIRTSNERQNGHIPGLMTATFAPIGKSRHVAEFQKDEECYC